MELTELNLSKEDHDQAFTEVSFLLDVITRTAKEMVGNPGPLGTTAGKQMGRKLPVLLRNPSQEEAMAVVQEKLKAGFDIACCADEGGMSVAIGRCAMRDVCQERNLALGGDLCTTFHYYLAGMTAELLGNQARPTHIEIGERCTLKLDIK